MREPKSVRTRTPARSRAATGLGLLALVAATAGLVAPEAAQAIVAPGGGAIEVLCDGDCGALPGRAKPGGDPFDFRFGAVAREDGIDLSIVARGSVYLLGPVRADEIVLFALGAAVIDGGLGTVVPPRIEPPRGDGGVIICACLEIVGPGGGSGGALEIGPGGDIRVAAVGGVSLPTPRTPPRAGLSISRDGDVYLDVSNVSLGRLFVKAFDAIVVEDFAAQPVPEPGPALLLGLGLTGLAGRRRA